MNSESPKAPEWVFDRARKEFDLAAEFLAVVQLDYYGTGPETFEPRNRLRSEIERQFCESIITQVRQGRRAR